MSATRSYMSSRTTIDSSTWTPIVALKAGFFFAMFNVEGKDVLIRTDPADANTEWPLSGSSQEGVTVAGRVEWQKNATIFYVKLAIPGTSVMILKMP